MNEKDLKKARDKEHLQASLWELNLKCSLFSKFAQEYPGLSATQLTELVLKNYQRLVEYEVQYAAEFAEHEVENRRNGDDKNTGK